MGWSHFSIPLVPPSPAHLLVRAVVAAGAEVGAALAGEAVAEGVEAGVALDKRRQRS